MTCISVNNIIPIYVADNKKSHCRVMLHGLLGNVSMAVITSYKLMLWDSSLMSLSIKKNKAL